MILGLQTNGTSFANIFFDVTVDKNGNFKSMGNELLFTQDTDYTTSTHGVDYTAGLKKGQTTLTEVKVGYTTYDLDLSGIQSAVASWLGTNGYTSAMAAFEDADNLTAAQLLSLNNAYVDNSQAAYVQQV